MSESKESQLMNFTKLQGGSWYNVGLYVDLFREFEKFCSDSNIGEDEKFDFKYTKFEEFQKFVNDSELQELPYQLRYDAFVKHKCDFSNFKSSSDNSQSDISKFMMSEFDFASNVFSTPDLQPLPPSPEITIDYSKEPETMPTEVTSEKGHGKDIVRQHEIDEEESGNENEDEVADLKKRKVGRPSIKVKTLEMINVLNGKVSLSLQEIRCKDKNGKLIKTSIVSSKTDGSKIIVKDEQHFKALKFISDKRKAILERFKESKRVLEELKNLETLLEQ